MNITIEKFKKSEPIFYGLGGKRIIETVMVSRWSGHPLSQYRTVTVYEDGRVYFGTPCLTGYANHQDDDKGELIYILEVEDGKVTEIRGKR